MLGPRLRGGSKGAPSDLSNGDQCAHVCGSGVYQGRRGRCPVGTVASPAPLAGTHVPMIKRDWGEFSDDAAIDLRVVYPAS